MDDATFRAMRSQAQRIDDLESLVIHQTTLVARLSARVRDLETVVRGGAPHDETIRERRELFETELRGALRHAQEMAGHRAREVAAGG